MTTQPNLTPSYSEIAKKIIKSSMRSAICIDDIYGAPYEDNAAQLNFEEPKRLYYSFRKTAECDLDIYRYKGNQEWQKHKHLIHNKDLMVLDWELDQASTPKFKDTLEVLDLIISSQEIPFVMLYTNTPNLSEVSDTLLRRYNRYDGHDYNALVKKLIEKFKNLSQRADDIEEFLEDSEKLFHDYIRTHSQRQNLLDEFVDNLSGFLEIAEDKKMKCPNKLNSTITDLYGTTEHLESMLITSNLVLSKAKEDNDFKCTILRVDIDKLCYSINGVIVLILNKSGTTDGVDPENLFEEFSNAISNNPHSIINLISLELKDKFREDFAKIGTRFNTIDERAFLHHASNYFSKGTPPKFNIASFKNFVVRSWIDDLLQHNMSIDLDSFHLIEVLAEEITDQNAEFHKSLGGYAAMVSTISFQDDTNFALGFGDLFKSESDYFLCITPHCDCFEPKKIRHQFYFTKGEKTNLESALKEAERGFYSFVFEDGKVDAIKWDCKPFTTYIPHEMNTSDRKELSYEGKARDLEYLCAIKENYTQRIANNSFGYGFRVGIDLPHINQAESE